MKRRITLVLLTLSLVLSSWPLFTSRATSGKTGTGQQAGKPFRLPAIAAGGYHSLALKSDGTVVAWGSTDFGQATVPVDLQDVTAIAAGQYHSLALKEDGNVISWGANDVGQTTAPADLSNVTAIAAGGYHSLALKGDGTVVAWGSNDVGQTTVPADLRDVTAIAAGQYHSLALKSDGTVIAWGASDLGQTTIPADLRDVTAIAAGSYHSLALKRDGTVVAWGGLNISGERDIPTGLSDVTAIAAGNSHSLALKNDGTVVAWGATAAPTDLSDVTAIAAGQFHSVALKSDGTVVAWGGNAYGQATAPADLSEVTANEAGSTRKLGVASTAAVSAPTITAATGLSIPAGSTTPRNLQIATATVGVTVTATPTSGLGVPIQNIRVDSTGKVTANVATDCGATTSKFTLRATNSSGLSATATLTITVTANTPPTLTYQSNYSFYSADDRYIPISIAPITGPSDNGSLSRISVSITPQGSVLTSIDKAGVISGLFNAGQVYTVQVSAVDNCGVVTKASFTFSIYKVKRPSIITVSQSIPAGSSSSDRSIAHISYDGPDTLKVTATAATGSGVTLNNLVFSGSRLFAEVSVACGATTSTFTLTATSAISGSATATLTITVTPPTNMPKLTYLASYSATYGTALTINPTTGPSDDIKDVSIKSITPSRPGGINVNRKGVVYVDSTVPRGNYTVTVRADGNFCGGFKVTSFTLAVK